MAPTKTSEQIERALRQRLLRRFRDVFSESPRRLLVGFSGGGDSLALSVLLKNVQRAIETDIQLVHVDHRIRKESAADTEQAEALAARVDLPFRLIRADAHPTATHPGVGLEEAARRVRFHLLSSIREQGEVVVLAHHAGDQVETMLLHLLRGAGLDGIAGMGEIDVLDVPWWGKPDRSQQLPIWRPVLRESRETLRSVLRGGKALQPIDDPSNDDTELRRNEIRHVLIPVIRQIEPTYEERFSELSQIADEDVDLLFRYANDALLGLRRDDGSLDSLGLAQLPIALGRRVVRAWLTERTGVVPSFDRVRAVLEFNAAEDFSGVVEVGERFVVGNFGFRLRCGLKDDLVEQAWRESVLALPLASSPQTIAIEGDSVVIRAPNGKSASISHTFPNNSAGAVTVQRVDRRAKRRDLKSDWGAWMRSQLLSPWIRDDIQGIAIDGDIRWIPRVSDQHEPVDGRVVRVEVWTEE